MANEFYYSKNQGKKMPQSNKSYVALIMLFVIGLALGAAVVIYYKPQLTQVNQVETIQKMCKCEIITQIKKRN